MTEQQKNKLFVKALIRSIIEKDRTPQQVYELFLKGKIDELSNPQSRKKAA